MQHLPKFNNLDSITGLVFSYDEGTTRYAALTEIQQPRLQNHR